MKIPENIYTSKYTAELGRELKIPVSKWQVGEGRKGQAAKEMCIRDAGKGCHPPTPADENWPGLCTLNPQG